MFKAILFDVDGTLIDTKDLIFSAYEHVLKKYKKKIIPREELALSMGGNIHRNYTKLLPDMKLLPLVKTHRDFLIKNLHLIKSYPRVNKTLKRIKDRGIKIAAVTSRGATAKKTLNLMRLTDLLDVIITGEDVKNYKPHPESLLKALKIIRMKPQYALMVGDSPEDILAGKNARVKTMGVTYGFFGKKELEKYNPDFIIEKIEDLIIYLPT